MSACVLLCATSKKKSPEAKKLSLTSSKGAIRYLIRSHRLCTGGTFRFENRLTACITSGKRATSGYSWSGCDDRPGAFLEPFRGILHGRFTLWKRSTWNLKTTGLYRGVRSSGPCHQVPCPTLPGLKRFFPGPFRRPFWFPRPRTSPSYPHGTGSPLWVAPRISSMRSSARPWPGPSPGTSGEPSGAEPVRGAAVAVQQMGRRVRWMLLWGRWESEERMV